MIQAKILGKKNSIKGSKSQVCRLLSVTFAFSNGVKDKLYKDPGIRGNPRDGCYCSINKTITRESKPTKIKTFLVMVLKRAVFNGST